MGLWNDRLLPRCIDVVLGTEAISAWRRRCVDGIYGVVVEPGFGSGLNLPHLPDDVTKVYAVDPAVRGQDLAKSRLEASAIDVEFVGLDGQSLPLDDDSCDCGLLTFTLCTIPDHESALAELRRVIKPGGALHFLEHGRSPDPKVAAWQDRITPIQKRVADGCHLNRPIAQLIEDAGFEIDHVESSYASRPHTGSYFTIGRALAP